MRQTLTRSFLPKPPRATVYRYAAHRRGTAKWKVRDGQPQSRPRRDRARNISPPHARRRGGGSHPEDARGCGGRIF